MLEGEHEWGNAMAIYGPDNKLKDVYCIVFKGWHTSRVKIAGIFGFPTPASLPFIYFQCS